MRQGFQWDEKKSAENARKHGISFEEAEALWADPLALTVPVDSLEHGEVRWYKVGTAKGKVWRAVCTNRGDEVRLISCHRANLKYKKAYEDDD